MKKSNYLIIVVALLLTSYAVNSDAAAQDLNAKIDALSAKIDALQTSVLSKLDAIEANSKNNSANSEDAAKAAFTEIQSLIAANQFADAKTKISEFQAKFASSQFAQTIEQIKREVEVVGKPSPAKWDIEKWYQNEKDVALDSDKPTLVVFWEVWCPHCKREIPKIVELQKTFGPKGVQFVGLTKLSRGTQESELLSFLKENNVTYAIGKEKGDLSTYFAVTGVPAAVFIKNRKVIWRGHPALASAEKIAEWMK